MGKNIEKPRQSIYLLHDVFVRKVGMQKKPLFESGKLMQLLGGKLLGRRQVLELSGLVGMSPQSKNLPKIHMFNGVK